MSHPDDVARLREIKRLLERIQRLPRLAGLPATGPMPCTLDDDPEDAATPMQHHGEGHLGATTGPPHPTVGLNLGAASGHGAGAREGGLEDVGESVLKTVRAAAPAADAETGNDDPLPAAFHYDTAPSDSGRGDYWATEWPADGSAAPAIDRSRALVAVRDKPMGSLSFSPWVFIVATAVNTVVAAVLAIVITLGVARRDTPPAETDKIAAVGRPVPEARPEPAVPRPLALRPVGSAMEPLRLEVMKPARLPFEVRPEDALEESYILVLTGMPPNASLSGAVRLGTDTWHLPPGALGKLEIVVPEWSATVLEIGVELRHTNGVVAAQSKLWLAVPPPPTPKGASLDEAGLKELVRTGDRHLSRGDVAAARAVYERAAAMGSAQAALAMGATFDPRRLFSLGVFGMVGNKERARYWYQRADELGHPEAKARIVALQ